MASFSACPSLCSGFKGSDSIIANARSLLAEDNGTSLFYRQQDIITAGLFPCLPAQPLAMRCTDKLGPLQASRRSRLSSRIPISERQRRRGLLAGRCKCSVGDFDAENEGLHSTSQPPASLPVLPVFPANWAVLPGASDSLHIYVPHCVALFEAVLHSLPPHCYVHVFVDRSAARGGSKQQSDTMLTASTSDSSGGGDGSGGGESGGTGTDSSHDLVGSMGCIARITHFQRLSDGRLLIDSLSLSRVRIHSVVQSSPFLMAEVCEVHDEEEELVGAFLAGMEGQQEAEDRIQRGPAAAERDSEKEKGATATAGISSSSGTGIRTASASSASVSSHGEVVEGEGTAVTKNEGGEEGEDGAVGIAMPDWGGGGEEVMRVRRQMVAAAAQRLMRAEVKFWSTLQEIRHLSSQLRMDGSLPPLPPALLPLRPPGTQQSAQAQNDRRDASQGQGSSYDGNSSAGSMETDIGKAWGGRAGAGGKGGVPWGYLLMNEDGKSESEDEEGRGGESGRKEEGMKGLGQWKGGEELRGRREGWWTGQGRAGGPTTPSWPADDLIPGNEGDSRGEGNTAGGERGGRDARQGERSGMPGERRWAEPLAAVRRVEKLSFAAASAVRDEMGRTHGRQEVLEATSISSRLGLITGVAVRRRNELLALVALRKALGRSI